MSDRQHQDDLDELERLSKELAEVKDQCNRQEHGFAQRESALQRELAQAHAAVKRLEEHAKLFDQECGMCGSDADELIEYMEWRSWHAVRASLRSTPDSALERVASLTIDAGPSLAMVCQFELSRRATPESSTELRVLIDTESTLTAVRELVQGVRGKYSHPDHLETAVFKAFESIAALVSPDPRLFQQWLAKHTLDDVDPDIADAADEAHA